MELQAQSVTPLYQQLYDILCGEINRGVYQPGGQIPSEDALCKTYGVSRVTVRSALGRMVDDGILVKKHGKGTFVAGPVFVESTSANGSFTKSCLQMGSVPSTHLVSRRLAKAGKVTAKHLGIADGESVWCVKRLRMTDGVPVIVEVDYFPASFDFLPGADLETTPILDVLASGCGRTGRFFFDTFDVRFAAKEQAALLDCPLNTPLLGISQVVYDEQRAPLYCNEQFIRSDLYKYAAAT